MIYEVWIDRFDGKGQKEYLIDRNSAGKAEVMRLFKMALENGWFFQVL